MNVVDKVMVWLGFERYDEPATPGNEGKVLYKKRGVDVIPEGRYQPTLLQGQAAARTHIGLTLFDKAVLWIFEKIVSPLMKPLPMSSAVMVAAEDIADSSISNISIDSLSQNKIFAEEDFCSQKKFIKLFLDKESWPSGGHFFSDETRNIANNHWKEFEKLTEKSGANEEDRLTYATAAFVLGKDCPSFQSVTTEPLHDVPTNVDDDFKREKETSVGEKISPQKSNGEILFFAFNKKIEEAESVEILSLGSVYMQNDCLEFAQKIVNRAMAIESGGDTEFTKEMLESATALLKRKRQLDTDEQKRIKTEEALKNKKIIENKKSSMQLGEWDFGEFVEDFSRHKAERKSFFLDENGKYRTNDNRLKFAEKVERDVNESEERREAATYLIRWNKHPAHAEKITREAYGFTLVPSALPPASPPPAPPPRTKRTAETEPDSISIKSGINTLPGQADSPPPPPPSTPRWMSTLSSMLNSASKSRDEMPEVFATMLMPHHGMEDRNLAWQGLYLLSSPPKNNLSSAVASENEAALSYQHNSISANTDDLGRLELAEQLIGFLQTLNIDEALKAVHVTRPSDEQIRAIRSLQKDASQIREELASRIKALLPAKKNNGRAYIKNTNY